ncbi:MAG: hypothetical protein LBU42_03870 [Prevotellaceae bacterium]|jgi:uncharacterized protein (TIGR02145 family)|nr:hypothetical protein [Prevotellaceae bacterium]
MKKIFFSLLLFPLLGAGGLSAAVTVTPLSVDYSTNKVTFKVEWTGTPTAPYNNRVWVWIDFCPITGTTPANSFSTATISNPAKTGGNGTVTNATERGFFIEYAATNAGTTVTATLSNASGKFNWCAYGSDYPPNVLANSNSSYTLAGTPSFILIASNGATSLTVPGTTIVASAVTFTPATITDATGYPGLWCPYTGTDLYMDATHRCLQRQSGAGNWEAWIKDSRDNELYRIVKMPDNKWWLAQNVKLASYNGSTVGAAISGCTKEECGRAYTWVQIYGNYGGSYGSTGTVQGICPPNWLLPLRSTYATLVSSIGTAQQAMRSLRPLNSMCNPKQNDHGIASVTGTTNGAIGTGQFWYTNDAGREDGFGIGGGDGQTTDCDTFTVSNDGESGAKGSVRCFR